MNMYLIIKTSSGISVTCGYFIIGIARTFVSSRKTLKYLALVLRRFIDSSSDVHVKIFILAVASFQKLHFLIIVIALITSSTHLFFISSSYFASLICSSLSRFNDYSTSTCPSIFRITCHYLILNGKRTL